MPFADGKLRLSHSYGSHYVDLTIPEYGYKSIIDLPFDIDTLDTGLKTMYAYDNTLDKYRCDCDLILDENDMTLFNEFMKTSGKGRAENDSVIDMNTGSGFFPFTPLRGDVGPFTVAVIINNTEKIQESPFRYFKVAISIFNQSTFPAFALPAEINEGSLSIGTVDNIRFPESYFDPDENNGMVYNITENGTLNFIDRGRVASSWRTGINLSCGTGKTAAILSYLIGIRDGQFLLSTQPYHYAFGRDKQTSGEYTVSLIQDQISIINSAFNKFEFGLNVQYISG
jgi:hypothetical protein